MAVLHLHDAAGEVRLFTLDGRSAGKVKLPGIGTARTLTGEKGTAELFYRFKSLLRPEAWYR